jgi:hypothetical protein
MVAQASRRVVNRRLPRCPDRQRRTCFLLTTWGSVVLALMPALIDGRVAAHGTEGLAASPGALGGAELAVVAVAAAAGVHGLVVAAGMLGVVPIVSWHSPGQFAEALAAEVIVPSRIHVENRTRERFPVLADMRATVASCSTPATSWPSWHSLAC